MLLYALISVDNHITSGVSSRQVQRLLCPRLLSDGEELL